MTFSQMMEQYDAEQKATVDIVDLSRLADGIDKLYKLQSTKAVGDVEVAKLMKAVTAQLSKISVPQFPSSISVKNQADWTQQFAKLTKAVKDFEAMYHMHEMEKMKHHQSKKEESYVRNEEKDYAKKEKEVDLECYRVADSAEPVTGDQYFGFLNEDGAWYILHNDAVNSEIRYKFGTEGYKNAWENYANHEFKLLNEAINEISS